MGVDARGKKLQNLLHTPRYRDNPEPARLGGAADYARILRGKLNAKRVLRNRARVARFSRARRAGIDAGISCLLRRGDFTGETAVSVFRNVSGKAIFSEMRTLRDLERERMGEWASAKLIEGAD